MVWLNFLGHGQPLLIDVSIARVYTNTVPDKATVAWCQVSRPRPAGMMPSSTRTV